VTAPARHVWIALAVVYVVWGSTYFAIKIAVETLPPLLAAGSRFLTAAILLAAILAWRGTSLRVSRAELGASALAGGLLLALGVGVVHVAETRIDSSVAAMIAGTVPLQIIVLRLVAGESPARATRISTLAGLLGLGLVVAPGLGSGSTALGLAVMISATIAWTLGSFLSKRLPLPADPFVATVWEMGLAGAFLLAGAVAFGEYGQLGSDAFALHSVLAWAYLVVLGSLVGFSAYAWLLRAAPISLVVTHQYVNPLVAIALGMAFLGERPSPWTLAGAVLVIGAVYVAIRAEFPRQSSRTSSNAAAERPPSGIFPRAGSAGADPAREDATSARPARVAPRGTPADQIS
jgi:drug/metabolite transporter (DMT)-like permease